MTTNEISLLAWHKFKQHVDEKDLKVMEAACKEERARIVREIQRSAKAVDAGVSKPDLWQLAHYIDAMTIWPFPTELPPAVPMGKLPFNPNNHEDAPL